jgi:hypothetical protein
MSSEAVIKILNWYKKHGLEASKLQVLLAVEYIVSYKYPLDISCNLALQSYID